ncbi:MAG: 1-acyl-sn-glycerol-3-phosphate acyltransferase [Clostridia bacterium]|nr:1-acyl-sn-glycerol-3-phosphate acyltransferase [Clostridia bacterium]
MKIKVKDMPYEEVLKLPKPKHIKPKKPNIFFRTLLKTVSSPDLKATDFRCERIGMDRLGKDEPALFLMNHSSFIDLKIASVELYPRPFNIVCTSDGFVGKHWLMRNLGCIPTRKFLTDATLVRDMLYTVRKLKSSILMYPEASYTFDGTATPLPDSLGKLLKMLAVPVIMIRTYGAFARDPLYNGLQLRKVKVSAKMRYILSPEEIKEKTEDELNSILKEHFTFDNFSWQKENGVVINEPFRADGLNRVLYKCRKCGREGSTRGKGIRLTCDNCGGEWELSELGELIPSDGGDPVHIPDWYSWERECVRKELEEGDYSLDTEVDISMLIDSNSLYRVGGGRLLHNKNGFTLTGCDGKLNVTLPPGASYSLYSDYFWYEIGDMICIGDKDALYYCFPKDGKDVVAKTRLAAEELYKMVRKLYI